MKWQKSDLAVVDTNVIISGLRSLQPSYPTLILGAWGSGVIRVAMSEHGIQEVLRILKKPRFSNLLVGVPGINVRMLLHRLLSRAVLIEPQPVDRKYFVDETDHFLAELVISARARALITGDKALLRANLVQETPVQSPKDFCKLYDLKTLAALSGEIV